MTAPATRRRSPIGVELDPYRDHGGAHARVWAGEHERVELLLERLPGAEVYALDAEGSGYFSGWIPGARAGDRYRFVLDGGDPLPDPASRFQPDGPDGPSEIVDPAAFAWTDDDWPGVTLPAQVLYEMHLGTFTPDGTYRAATERLPSLADLGVTVIELMPVADFAGRFGWGYDGVNLFAPTRLYGRPDDLRAFVDAAHAHGIGVILDVVYNHLGPRGNQLPRFGRYFGGKRTEWGDALDFDGVNRGPVREFILANAAYWVEEFHVDGLRLDATQQIFDESPRHIVAEIAEVMRGAALGRNTLVIAENEPQRIALIQPPEAGGMGLDALWNDDFHHAARVAVTGRSEAYFSGYRGTAQELLSAVKHGFLYQGQWYTWQKQRRGSPALGIHPRRYVHYVQNHDQVANTGTGQRLHQQTSHGRYRAITALLLLGPQTPMLFQGQEFAASSPFLYFADHDGELARQVRSGRARFLSQFESIAVPESAGRLPDPADPETFTRCKLDWIEREQNAWALALHRDLLELRRADLVIRAQAEGQTWIDGAVLDARAFVVRFFGGDAGDRLLVVNLGSELRHDPAPEPLLAPPAGARWATLWSSEDPRYGGRGTPPLDRDGHGWHIPAECAVLLDGRSSAT